MSATTNLPTAPVEAGHESTVEDLLAVYEESMELNRGYRNAHSVLSLIVMLLAGLWLAAAAAPVAHAVEVVADHIHLGLPETDARGTIACLALAMLIVKLNLGLIYGPQRYRNPARARWALNQMQDLAQRQLSFRYHLDVALVNDKPAAVGRHVLRQRARHWNQQSHRGTTAPRPRPLRGEAWPQGCLAPEPVTVAYNTHHHSFYVEEWEHRRAETRLSKAL